MKRRTKTKLEEIAEVVKTVDLRLRLASELDNPERHRAIAVDDLTVVINALRRVKRAVVRGVYP